MQMSPLPLSSPSNNGADRKKTTPRPAPPVRGVPLANQVSDPSVQLQLLTSLPRALATRASAPVRCPDTLAQASFPIPPTLLLTPDTIILSLPLLIPSQPPWHPHACWLLTPPSEAPFPCS